jgi:hypothetical protein
MDDKILYRFVGPRDADGKPTEWVTGIPARDLTAADVARVERRGLLDTLKGVAIYKAVNPPAAKSTAKASSDAGKEG